MSQKYQNEKSPILNGQKKSKTSEKVQKMRDLEGPTSFRHLCSTLYSCLQSCVIWLYAVPSLVPSSLDHLEPHTTPYILPCTHIALTGAAAVIINVFPR